MESYFYGDYVVARMSRAFVSAFKATLTQAQKDARRGGREHADRYGAQDDL